MKEAIDKLKGRSSHRESSRSDEPIRVLRVRNDNDNMNWEFSFKIEIIREDLNLWVELGEVEIGENKENKNRHPLEVVNEDQIYQAFIEQYKKELINKFVPE